MMKLKDILFETYEKTWKVSNENLELLQKMMRSRKYIILPPNQLIYRGVGHFPNLFAIKNIRKDREPRNTSLIMHVAIEGLRQHNYPQYPSRNRSLFCTSSKRLSYEFGDPVVVFPEKNSTMYYANEDTYDVLNFAGGSRAAVLLTNIPEVYNDLKKEHHDKLTYIRENYHEVYEILNGLRKIRISRAHDIFNRDIDLLMREIKECAEWTGEWPKQILDKTRGPLVDLMYVIYGLYNLVESSVKYFKMLDRFDPFKNKGEEILIEADTALVINEKKFSDHFEWNGNEYVMKEPYEV